jgi:hypothetical protein
VTLLVKINNRKPGDIAGQNKQKEPAMIAQNTTPSCNAGTTPREDMLRKQQQIKINSHRLNLN